MVVAPALDSFYNTISLVLKKTKKNFGKITPIPLVLRHQNIFRIESTHIFLYPNSVVKIIKTDNEYQTMLIRNLCKVKSVRYFSPVSMALLFSSVPDGLFFSNMLRGSVLQPCV